ncbi:uncharacterized protein LOC131240613 [Magnolia sinica]|uniref:uncharacterized protein LOC131240613 n=1 Tax=Magnolia sinica TaxID=86752 RepID=UPI00265942B3|nr:uncharacterized protein LOC131240613 [Magnolia sinica]
MIPSNGGGASRVLDLGHHLLISSVPFSLAIPSTSPPPWKYGPALPFQNPNLLRNHFIRCSSSKRTGPFWDSNAESVRAGRFRFRDESFDNDEGGRREKRKWWSDDDSSEFDEDNELFDEQPWDSIWIFKVFRSFGWLLPAIIISTLLTTGPKAFLMALALPLGQSALSLAIDKVWGKTQDGPKRKSKTKNKPFASATSNTKWRDDKESSDNGQARGYQSWVATNDGVVEKGSSQRQPSFGGWDELDRRGESDKGPRRQPGRTTSRPPRPQPETKGKLTRRGKNSDVPLLLRLLIAVFPFLGSWTKFL